MDALPSVQELTFLLAMRLDTDPWSNRTSATLNVGDYLVEAERDNRPQETGYEASVHLKIEEDEPAWILNSYNSGVWPQGITYQTLEDAVVGILAAIRAHRDTPR